MKTKVWFILACSIWLSAPVFASAALPELITYQGRVVDSEEVPLDGPFDVTFRIYESESAPVEEAIWSETHAGVPIAHGDFSIKIGSVSTESAAPLRNLPFDKPYWLGIEISNQGELLPREAFESVPFAYRVHDGVTLSEDQVITGDKIFSGTVQITGDLSAFGLVPIGSIMAWHKSFSGTPVLPDGWVECNGQAVNDIDSVYNGQAIPNLNGNNNFLRGNSTSGGTGGAATHDHGGQTGSVTHDAQANGGSSQIRAFQNGQNTHAHTISSVSNLPPYHDVVWIMRIK